MIHVTRLFKNGRVTIPVEVRRELGLKPGDAVLWTKDARGNLTVRPVRSSLDDFDGFLPALDHLSAEIDVGDMIHQAQSDVVDERPRKTGTQRP
jgi:AbrB family looped-hinge helix DNA binding protein